jgi:hypothetical protein
MNEPNTVPEIVEDTLKKWSVFHKCDMPLLKWDDMLGCYTFWHRGVFYGVELDGHMHT